MLLEKGVEEESPTVDCESTRAIVAIGVCNIERRRDQSASSITIALENVLEPFCSSGHDRNEALTDCEESHN